MSDDTTTSDRTDAGRAVTPAHDPPEGASSSGSWTSPDGSALEYRVEAGWTVLRDGETPTAEVFSTSYLVEGDDPRPVTFVFNGGPGAASAYLHVGVAGPLTVEFGPDGQLPAPPARVSENPDSWIAFTDLVFVDPVGTGFSRVLPSEDDEDDEDGRYYEEAEDLAAIGQFISRWLTAHRRWDAEVFVAGESYGGYRVGRLARKLQEDIGVGLVGIVLISPALEIEALSVSDYNVTSWVDRLPSMALAAVHHGRSRIDGDEAAVEAAALAFAQGDYARLLLAGAGMPADDRDAVLARLADLLGLDEALVRRHRGRVPMQVFARELLRDERRLLGLYDATVTTVDPFPDRDPSPGPDPTLAGIEHVFATGVNHVLRDVVGVETERQYVLLSLDVNTAWRRAAGTHAFSSMTGASDDLRYGLALNPHLRALVVHGRHDLVTPWAASRRLRDLLHLDEDTAARVTDAVYDGGHMFYTRVGSRASFTADVARLVTGG